MCVRARGQGRSAAGESRAVPQALRLQLELTSLACHELACVGGELLLCGEHLCVQIFEVRVEGGFFCGDCLL